MGVEERWQDRVPRRVPAWRGRDDRNSRVHQRSRWMLIAGSALLLVAMMLARWLPHGRAAVPQNPRFPWRPPWWPRHPSALVKN